MMTPRIVRAHNCACGLGGAYSVSDRLTLGARLVTGDADDPNSTDVQLSDFDDNFELSLDLAYAQLNLGGLQLYGGRIPQPFVHTDLVWDGDVIPQGLSAVFSEPLASATLRASALFFIIDEQAVAADATMRGVQVGYDFAPADGWGVRRHRLVLRLSSGRRGWR